MIPSDPVLVSLISTMGGVSIAYIANVLSRRRQRQNPDDRFNNVFNGYENLLKRQDQAISYKDQQLTVVQQQLEDLTRVTAQLRNDLDKERRTTQRLRDELNDLRAQYGVTP